MKSQTGFNLDVREKFEVILEMKHIFRDIVCVCILIYKHTMYRLRQNEYVK